MKVGLVSISFRHLTPEQVISHSVKAGIGTIEWGSDSHLPETDLENAKRIAQMTKDAEIQMVSYGSYYKLGKGMDIVPYLETAKAIDVSIIRIWAGTRGSEKVTDEERKLLVAEAVAVSQKAAEYGITICFEYHPNTLTDNYHSALRLMQEVNLPNCRLYWQPNYNKSLEENLEALKAVLPYVDIIHVFYWSEAKDQLPLAGGRDIWRQFLQISKEKPHIQYLLEFVPEDHEKHLPEEAAVFQTLMQEEL